MDMLSKLAPGVFGYAVEDVDGSIWIPDIRAVREGSGAVGRFLDALDPGRTFCFPTVISERLAGMLRRRGYIERSRYDLERRDVVTYFERQGVR